MTEQTQEGARPGAMQPPCERRAEHSAMGGRDKGVFHLGRGHVQLSRCDPRLVHDCWLMPYATEVTYCFIWVCSNTGGAHRQAEPASIEGEVDS